MAQFEEFPSPTSRIEVCLDELAAHLGKAALRSVMYAVGLWMLNLNMLLTRYMQFENCGIKIAQILIVA